MTEVALLECDEYTVETVERKIRDGFELLGGEVFIKKIIPPRSSVLLKPNLLSAEEKGSPVVTDYRVFEAVIRVLRDYTDNITYGDSPGFGASSKAAETTGLAEVAKRYGVSMENFDDWTVGQVPSPLLVSSFDIAKAALEKDVVITLPRIKTHGMMSYTGAIKNQFGCISGLKKASWHSRMQKPRNFGRMLLDLNTLVGTDFVILDGIVAMEGNGPKNGTPRKMNTLLMGKSLSAVDSVAARLIGYDPMDIPYLHEAYRLKWGPVKLKDIDVVGEPIEKMKVEDFQHVRGGSHMNFSSAAVINSLLGKYLAPRPVLLKEKCIACRKCGKICPERPYVITFPKKYPHWNYKKCISCFCCQEICPTGAIEVKYPQLAKLLRIDK